MCGRKGFVPLGLLSHLMIIVKSRKFLVETGELFAHFQSAVWLKYSRTSMARTPPEE